MKKMNTKIKLILKKILLFSTIIYSMLFVASLESLSTTNITNLILLSLIELVLLISCIKLIKSNEYDKLILNKRDKKYMASDI